MDAYTLRKVAPRILLAVIGINLSIYICVAMIDLTTIIGQGIGSMLTGPFIGAGNFDFNLTRGGGIGAIAEGLGATAAGGLILKTIAFKIIGTAIGGSGGIGGFLIFSILIPVIFIILAGLCVIAIRQGLLVFLVVVSPVAFALFVLPTTEKYFKQWWDLFVKTLLIYPILAVIFAMCDIMPVVTTQTTTSSTVAAILGLIFAFLPLVLIPFSFKFAGGLMSTLVGVVQKGYKQAQKDGGWLSRQQGHYKQQLKDREVTGRSQLARRGQSLSARQGRRNALTRRYGSFLQSGAHGYTGDIFAQESALNERMGKEKDNSTGFGDDALWRAYSWSGRKDDTRVNADTGQTEIRTAGGAWVDKSYHDQAVKKFGKKNSAAYQQALTYEMGKAITQEQQDHLLTSFQSGAQEMGLTQEQAVGVWKGAGFAKQNENRQFKHYSPTVGADGGVTMAMDGKGLITEIDEKQGSYQGAMQNAETWTTMSSQVMESQVENHKLQQKKAANGGALTDQADINAEKYHQEVLTRAARIADSISTPVPVRDKDGNLQPGDASVGAGAPGRVGEEMRAFAEIAKAGGQDVGFDPKQYGTTERSDDAYQGASDRGTLGDTGREAASSRDETYKKP